MKIQPVPNVHVLIKPPHAQFMTTDIFRVHEEMPPTNTIVTSKLQQGHVMISCPPAAAEWLEANKGIEAQLQVLLGKHNPGTEATMLWDGTQIQPELMQFPRRTHVEEHHHAGMGLE
jgi:hypothetical protein